MGKINVYTKVVIGNKKLGIILIKRSNEYEVRKINEMVIEHAKFYSTWNRAVNALEKINFNWSAAAVKEMKDVPNCNYWKVENNNEVVNNIKNYLRPMRVEIEVKGLLIEGDK